ncbi:STAG-domain-containing protein [Lindgomyces ingoldianus]|uniref:STAG-domain-containing protein n=1 Tax=Lindgomyces ingoldianus TaxID=673940 RepID=A0ACB6QGN0_9PLEO|nr:STAG-domain-containing protein [Lindgomyces ingoldianus]KAF2466081.1 STAG-domain-containing protein [Lindgomyces ingoldianus]
MSAAVMSSEAVDITSSVPRRKSGRVSKKPEPFVPASSPAGSAKRKRNVATDGDGDGDVAEQASEEEQTESSEGEPDEEELRERRRKKKTKPAPKRPASKKPKTNGESISLAIRPAASNPQRPRKPRKGPIRKSAIAEDAEGLYADVFARGSNLEDAAAQWVSSFQEHEARAVSEVQNVSDYPLIAKGGAAFKNALHGFFIALVQTIAQNGLLYDNVELIENIEVWVSTMSSASNRPFRHTSTVASLAVISALCQAASDVLENTAKKMRQVETESKKARVNKGRVSAVNKEVAELNSKLEIVNGAIKDWFETVFIHRYRDVDPRIRVECVEALADWIMIYPDKFFDGSHLRYLGWVLSDPQPHTRLEVVKQLQKLFHDKEKIGGLKTFTERFRPRMVEMATRDSEANVRASTVELLDILREAGLLEPDDIDSVGKLIFDAEPKVRKAVVGFFAENVNNTYDYQIEDMGGQETLDEALAPIEGDEGYDTPRVEWLKLKCLVEQLVAYDSDGAELPSQVERLPPSGSQFGLVAAPNESRFSVATQVLYDAIPEIRSWEVIAGYLLYDHSETLQNGAGEDAEMALRQNCKPTESEETKLLEILNATVKHRLARVADAQHDKKSKKTKAQRQADQEEQEEMAKRLAVLIPKLLKKFGAQPEAASTCLSLARAVNFEIFQELRQDSTLNALLDDICKQFLTHHDKRVLIEAKEAILHAASHEELKEIVEGKLQAIWDDITDAFSTLIRGRDISTRGNMSDNILTGIMNTVSKIAILTQISQPDPLDHVRTKSKSKSKKGTADQEPPISSLLQILHRGIPVADLDTEVETTEDALVRNAMEILVPYFGWKFKSLSGHILAGTRIPDDDLTVIAERRDLCIEVLMEIIDSRKGSDDLRIEASCLLLDVYNIFFSLRNIKDLAPKPTSKPSRARQVQEEANDDWEALCQEVDQRTTRSLLQVLTAAEATYAKRAKKHLEEVNVDDDPVDPDDEPEDSGDEEEEDVTVLFRTLIAENQLCLLGSRLITAVHAGTLDGKSSGDGNVVRKRLERNKARLGHNWKEVVGYLDISKSSKGKGAAAKKVVKTAKEPAKAGKSKEIVIEDDSEEEEEQGRDEDEEMAEAEQNGDIDALEKNGALDQSPEVESVLGD